MEDRVSLHYKNKNPIDTVEYIKSILKNLDIKVDEEWMPQSSAETYSLRLWINGTNLGTNGKGMTQEYARASAYAELMERLQNCWIARFYYRKQDLYPNKYYYSYDEKKISTKDLVTVNNAFNNMLFNSCDMVNYPINDKIKIMTELQQLEFQLTGERDTWTMVPFYSVRTDEIIYLPYFLYTNFYGSNGMCAGNTPTEAIIQGLSEIIERYVQRQVILNSYTLPSIPDEFLNRYPIIKRKMDMLNNIPGYRFVLKDCSLNGRYPVVALASIQLDTGFFGLKFGCHPDIEIAMERAITETSQGIDFKEYCKKSKINFKNDIVRSEENIANICYSGRGQYPFEIFLDIPTFEFREVKDIRNKSDEEILKYLIK